MRRTDGFTLVELMVSSVILIVVMIYLTTAFVKQQQTYVVVDQVTEAQQNLRAVADLIVRDVRRAGFMVPPHGAVCGWDSTSGPDTLFVSNTDAIRTVFNLEMDDGDPTTEDPDLAGNFGATVSGVTSTWARGPGTVSFTLDQLWIDVAADGDDFAANQGVILLNRRDEEGKFACGIIQSVAGNTLTVDLGGTSIGPAGSNADVVAVPAHVYRLTGASPSQLRRDGLLLASDVEDFQVTYFFDLDDDRVADVGENFGTAGGTANPFTQAAASWPNALRLIEVGINVVTATRDDDPNQDYTRGAGQLTGNRASGLPINDGKRRRVYSARVRLRNQG